MRRALTYLLLAQFLCPCYPAGKMDRRTWNRVRYVGGTIPVKASPYDWNTTLTVTLEPPSIVLTIAPASVFGAKRTVRIAANQVTSLSNGQTAWRRAGEVAGAMLPSKSPALFGLLRDNSYLAIVFQTGDGKPASILLETRMGQQILAALKEVTGKSIEESP
jgi:hypothetical protein